MGEPLIKGQISNCATGQISTEMSTISWYSVPTDQEKKFVCQIRQGRVCPGGWVMHGDNCFKWFVGGHYWRSWYAAEEYCTKIGAKMLIVKGLVFYFGDNSCNQILSFYWLYFQSSLSCKINQTRPWNSTLHIRPSCKFTTGWRFRILARSACWRRSWNQWFCLDWWLSTTV